MVKNRAVKLEKIRYPASGGSGAVLKKRMQIALN
jgi:hypothetical protein